MDNKTKRMGLFLIGCIGVRTLAAWFAATADRPTLRIMSYVAALISLGFILIYVNGWRKTGPEVFGDKIWWNRLRPVHSLLYGLFAYFAYVGNRNSYVFLAVDVTIGLLAFLAHHFAGFSA
jgi:hypothetical protein